MNNKKHSAARLWKDLEDDVVPALRLSPVDRIVYGHLLRHSLLEGRPHIRFSLKWLARGTNLSTGTVRPAVRRLAVRGALRLLQRTKLGHFVRVVSPREIRSTRVQDFSAIPSVHQLDAELKNADFLQTRGLREAIHDRERGLCFYCLRRVSRPRRCLDHVVPRARRGGNSYRNLVSACMECNAQKGESSAKDFLRRLYREERLSGAELAGRLQAVDALAADKLRPVLPPVESPRARRVKVNGLWSDRKKFQKPRFQE
jgi:5-methylcytosine-specific restriction endonuclease McrA